MPKIPRDISGRKLAKLLEKYGTLNNILNDIANYLKVDKKKIIEELFRS